MPWLLACDDPECNFWCRKPDCAHPGYHGVLCRSHYSKDLHRFVGEHRYDCSVVLSPAREALDELRPGLEPQDIAVIRHLLDEALDKLDRLERQERQSQRPTIYRASA